ncbi:MAG: hypothetical protein WC052_01320 [Patescibacteria group bacterium]
MLFLFDVHLSEYLPVVEAVKKELGSELVATDSAVEAEKLIEGLTTAPSVAIVTPGDAHCEEGRRVATQLRAKFPDTKIVLWSTQTYRGPWDEEVQRHWALEDNTTPLIQAIKA